MEAENKEIFLHKKVFSRPQVSSVMDREFREFGQKEVASEKTVEQFFADYEDLFYLIPIEGTINSHQYLVEKSSELYKTNSVISDIQPLINEINSLRAQLVLDQQTIMELRSQIK